jgi:hypothetical protein
MSSNPRAVRRPKKRWRITSVYERRRDGPKRIEQAYRILIEGGEGNPEKMRRRG